MANDEFTTDDLVEPGNIDLDSRPIVRNSDGSISTTRSISFELEGNEILIPTIADDGTQLSNEEAIDRFKRTGRHLGIFKSGQAADKFAKQLSNNLGERFQVAEEPTDFERALSRQGLSLQPEESAEPTEFEQASSFLSDFESAQSTDDDLSFDQVLARQEQQVQPEPSDEDNPLPTEEFQRQLGGYLQSDSFKFETFEEKIDRLRSIFLGKDQAGLNWEEGTKELYLESVQALRLMDDVQVQPSDYSALLPEFGPVEEALKSDQISRSQKIQLLDMYEATALSVARDQGGVFWDEIKDVAEKQIAREVDELKRDIQGGATLGQITEKLGEPGRAISALATTNSRFAKGIISDFVGALLPESLGEPLSRAVETSVFLPEDPVFRDVVFDIPGTEQSVRPEALARGVGQGFAFIGGASAVAARAGLATSATAMMGANVRLTYGDAYQRVFERTGNEKLAIEAGVKAMPIALIETLFDAAVVGRAIRPLRKSLTTEAKRRVVAEGINRGAFGTTLKDGFRGASNVLGTAALEGTAEGVQEVLTGEVAASVAGDTALEAQTQEIIESTAVGALVGGAVQTAGSLAARDAGRSVLEQAGGQIDETTGTTETRQGQELDNTQAAQGEAKREEAATGSTVETIAAPVAVEPEPTIAVEPEPTIAVEPAGEKPAPQEGISEENQTVTGSDAPGVNVEKSELTTSEGKTVPIERRRIPLEQLVVQKDIPQFKRGADPETGVVGDPEALGEFNEAQAGNIIVLEKKSGELEVVTGRNRLASAKRTEGQADIPAFVVKEADGFTIDDAKTLDAEFNIRDNQGEVEDFAKFFERSKTTREQAQERGLLRSSKAQRGFAVGKLGSDELRSAFFSGRINEKAAAAIANAAPNDSASQRVGLQQALQGKSAELATNMMQVAKAAEGLGGKSSQQSLFGENDQALKDAETLANAATDLQRETRQTLQTLKRAQQLGKTPNLEQLPGITQGVNISDPQALQREIDRLSNRLQDFQNWAVRPELVREVQTRAQQDLEGRGQQLEINLTPTAPVAPRTEPQQGSLLSRESRELTPREDARKALAAVFAPLTEDEKKAFRNKRNLVRRFRNQGLTLKESIEEAEKIIEGTIVLEEIAPQTFQAPSGTLASQIEPPGATRPQPSLPPGRLLFDFEQLISEDVLEDAQPSEQPSETPKRQPEPPIPGDRVPIENLSTPAAIRLAKQITLFVPTLFKSDALLRGMYQRKTGRTFINEKLPRDEEALNRTIAHEIGHAVDLLSRQPNQTGMGSNLLGRLVPLAKFGKKVFGKTEVIEKLLPTQQIDHQGEEYQVVVSYGVIRAFQKKEVSSKAKGKEGETVEQFVPISPRVLPEEVLDEFASNLREEQAELFDRVRNWTRREGPRPITERYSKDSEIGAVMADPVLRSEAWELSRRWRPLSPDANEKFMGYRLRPEELYADFFSALVNSPQWVERNYPNLFNAFKTSLQGKPDALAALEELAEFVDNPDSLLTLLQVDSAIAANKSIDIAKQEIENRTQTRQHLLERIKNALHPWRALKTARQMYMENFVPVLDALGRENKLLEERKKKALETLARLTQLSPQSRTIREAKIRRIVRDMRAEKIENSEVAEAVKHIPQRQWIYVKDIIHRVESQLDRLGIKADDFHNFMVADRILNETTPTREWILQNPDDAKQALTWVIDNAALAGYSTFDKAQFQEIAESDLEGEALATEMAKLDLELETTDPKGRKRQALARLADNIQDENLLGLVTDGFNVRRYMANPNGWTPKESQQIIDKLEEEHGKEKFDEVRDIRQTFADANWEVIKEVNKAGLISPDFFKRLTLNKDHYVSFNVLHYFAENPKFSARFNKQVGTFKDIGNTLMSTVGKKTMLLARAVRQQSVNEIIETARRVYEDLNIDGVREVTDTRGRRIRLPKLVFETLNRKRDLQGDIRNDEFGKSYLIEYRAGQPILIEIDDPSWQRMTEQMRVTDLGPVTSLLLSVQQLQKAFYTVLSPAFVFGTDPVRNKAREARLASTIVPKVSLLWWHLSPSLAKKSDTAKKISKNLVAWATGETNELAQDTPFRDEVLELVKTGRIMLPISGRLDLARTVVGTPDVSPEALSQKESLAEMAQLLGASERFGNNLIADSIDLTSDIIGNVPVIGDLGHSFVEILGRQAQLEEIRTKLTGYLIERERTETLRDAGQRAELWYGAPRARGGGSRNAEAEAVFLFWRVTAYTPRVMKQIITEEPVSGANVIARSLLQKAWMLPATGAVMAAAISQVIDLDDEEEEKFKKNLDWAYRMIGRYEKSAQNPIPFGFYNAKQDKFVSLWEADTSDLANGWEAVYWRRPADPDERILNRYVYSLLEGVTGVQTTRNIFQQLTTDTKAELPDVAPALTSVRQIVQFMAGENPSDDFYDRGVLPRELEKGGTVLEKTLKFGEFLLAKHLPYFNYKLTTEEKRGMEKALAALPGSSKLLGISGYGLIEEANTDKKVKEFERDSARLKYSPEVKSQYREYFRLQKMGKDGRTRDQQRRYLALGNWKFSVFDYYDNEIRHARRLGEDDYVTELENLMLRDTKRNANFWKASRGRRKAQKKRKKLESSSIRNRS